MCFVAVVMLSSGLKIRLPFFVSGSAKAFFPGGFRFKQKRKASGSPEAFA
jgi:hypothetical protein